jgi:uncharacterized repeat protein (TIGR03803 family)
MYKAFSLSVTFLSLVALMASSPAHAQTYSSSIIHSFSGPPDGMFPFAGLVLGKEGDLYGTTGSGGRHGFGSVYKIGSTGKESVVYSFAGKPDGASPGVLILGQDGEFYGVTNNGGAYGSGTVFKITASGEETLLYSFTGGSDGSGPNGALVRDAEGNLYGVTLAGGASGLGTVFKLGSDGTETVLHSFTGMPDGEEPTGGLVRDGAGNLYGTTYVGGPYAGCGIQAAGCGIVFKVGPTGEEKTLYNFDNPRGGLDGYQPLGRLSIDAAGNLYGTTEAGGADALYGSVFKITPAGEETLLYSFYGDDDGENPEAGVILDSAGNLYGTTLQGGNKGPCYGGFFYSGCGTVFEVTPDGGEIQLHVFGGTNGEYPEGSLVIDAAGKLYGTVTAGGPVPCGPNGCGLVFELTPQ